MQEGQTSAQLLTNQSSGVLSSATLSDGLLILPQDTKVQLGDMLEFIPFSELGAC
jgi:molybdopterin molybdotransferase